jgi:hypothetical protein
MQVRTLLACLALAACGSSSTTTVPPEAGATDGGPIASPPDATIEAGFTGRSCTVNADCAPAVCIFAVVDGCSARGACYLPPPPTGTVCNAIAPACTCQGDDVSLVCNATTYPTGYFEARIAHAGKCPRDAGPG